MRKRLNYPQSKKQQRREALQRRVLPVKLSVSEMQTGSDSAETKAINKIIGTGKRFMAYEIVDRLEKLGRWDLLKLMSEAVNPSERQRNKSMKRLKIH